MRFLGALLALICLTQRLSAAEPAELGNLLAALDEKNPQARCSALLYTLENSGRASSSLLRILDAEMGGKTPEKDIQKRLTGIWQKRPDDLRTAEFVLKKIALSDIPSGDILQMIRNTLKSVDLAQLSAGEKVMFYRMLSYYDKTLQNMYELPAAAEFYDTLTARFPGDIQLAVMAAELYKLGCFRDNDTAPGMRNWDALSPKNIWKKRLLTLRRNGAKMVPQNAADAVVYPLLATTLYDRRLLLRAMEFRRSVPVVKVALHLSLPYFGALLKEPEWCREASADTKPLLLAAAGDPAGAEKALADAPAEMKTELTLTILLFKRDYKRIREIANSGYIPRSSRGCFAFLDAAEKLQDTSLVKKVISALPEDFYKQNRDDANALGYTCAVLGYELPMAEKIMRAVLDAEPDNYAYLDSYAWLLYRQKKYREAREYIGRALKCREAEASVSVLFLHAAAIEFAATGDRIAAVNYLERAEKLRTPDIFDYDENLARKLFEELK